MGAQQYLKVAHLRKKNIKKYSIATMLQERKMKN